MNVFLGYYLDSDTYPDALGEKVASVGNVVTGFHGLIGIIETQLGLTSPKISENLRIAQWQALLRQYDTGNMPYSKSLETDSWNSAREMLRRRDELVLAGWDASVHKGGSIWIDTLAQLEQANTNKINGFSDRVRAVLTELRDREQLLINSITIVDEDESLWEPWAVQLVNELERIGVQVTPCSAPLIKNNHPTTDLALLQSILSGENTAGQASGDGSLLLIRSEQEWDAADFLISWLQENGGDETVLIKNDGSLLLHELLHRRGVPAPGVNVTSKWRAVLQVLPLTIDTYWRPIRVERMLELLTIPTSPVPGRIRNRLAKALASNPGIGGPEWIQAIDEGLAAYEQAWIEEGIDEHEIKWKRKNIEAQLELWVNHDYYDANEGIPYEKLVQICQKVGQWAATRFAMINDLMYAQAMQHTQEVVEGVKTLGVTNVTRLQVARILESVLGDGAVLTDYHQEASKWQVVNEPGQLWGSADTILWWGFNKNMSGPSIKTWTSKERNWLKEQGVNLPNEDIRRLREAASWQRAARLANRRLIMFAPMKAKGAEIPIHPFWDEIRYAVAKDEAIVNKITIDAQALRKQSSHPLFGEQVERMALNKRNLPDPIRTWKVSENVVLPRVEESATSFEGLIGCPLKWTFKYAANIKPGSILSLPNESLMLGNLGHIVLESLINEKPYWSGDEVVIRVGELFDNLTPMLAAPLLEPQNGILRNQTRTKLQTSLQQFFKVLNQAGIAIKHTEHELQKTWSDGVEFKGRLDLVGETQTGKKILFDAKWSRRQSNYKKRLENLSVQLTLYHWLLADHEDEELPIAYFMLRSGDFFSLPHDDFPADYHVKGPSLLESHAVVRNSVEEVWAQLRKGTVIASGVPVTMENSEESFVPTIDPPCAFCEYQNLCGVRRLPV